MAVQHYKTRMALNSKNEVNTVSMPKMTVRDHGIIRLGKQGENEVLQVIWRGIVPEWEEKYGAGEFQLAVKRNQDTAPYIANIELDGGDIVWTITSAETARVGDGECELTYTVGDSIAKSQIWTITVCESLTGQEPVDPPEPAKNWVDVVIKSASDAKQSATESAESAKQAAESAVNAQKSAEKAEDAVGHAPIIGENGNWFVWDFVQSKYVDTGKAASTPPINTDTAGKHLVNDGEKSKWQDMSPLIVNITKDGQDKSGEPIYKSDKAFDEIKAAYDIGREIKLMQVDNLDSFSLQYYCGSEPKLVDVSDNSAVFFCVGTATAFFNNEFNSMSLYGGLPTFFITIEIRKTENGDVVEVDTSFTTNSEGQPVFDQDFITKMSSSNLIPVIRTEKGLECGVDAETVLLMVMGWLEGVNDPTKPISYSPTKVLLLGLKNTLGGIYDLCNVDLYDPDDGTGSTVSALFVRTTGVGISLVLMMLYSNKADWYYYDYPFNFDLFNVDADDNGKFLRVVNGKWEKAEFDGSDLSFGINNAKVNDFLRVDSVTDGVPTRWKVDSIANAKGVNF
jgi:hypothetical protein